MRADAHQGQEIDQRYVTQFAARCTLSTAAGVGVILLALFSSLTGLVPLPMPVVAGQLVGLAVGITSGFGIGRARARRAEENLRAGEFAIRSFSPWLFLVVPVVLILGAWGSAQFGEPNVAFYVYSISALTLVGGLSSGLYVYWMRMKGWEKRNRAKILISRDPGSAPGTWKIYAEREPGQNPR